VEGDPELACLWVIDAEKPPLVLQHQSTGTSCIVPSYLKRKRKRKLACASLAPFKFPHFFPSLFL
jgi:hypothetical protein